MLANRVAILLALREAFLQAASLQLSACVALDLRDSSWDAAAWLSSIEVVDRATPTPVYRSVLSSIDDGFHLSPSLGVDAVLATVSSSPVSDGKLAPKKSSAPHATLSA